MTVDTFVRATAPDMYANTLAHLFASGYRIYDPSTAAAKDPDSEAKLMRWPPFATALQVRHTSIAGKRWTVAAADDGGDDEKALARLIARLLGHIDGFTQSRINLARADVTGARYAEVVRREVVAKYGDGKPRRWVVPTQLRDMPKENFRWDADSNDQESRAVLKFARKKNGVVTWVKVPSYAPLVRHVIGDSEETLGYGRGLRDALWFIYEAAFRVHQADVQAAERTGHGWLVLKMASDKPGAPTITNAQMSEQASAALNKMRAKHNFVIDKDDTLEFLAPPAQAAEFMSALADRLERMGDRLITAGTMFTGGQGSGKGGYAQADVEAETGNAVFDVLGDQMEETLTRDLVAATVRDNWANLVEMGFEDTDHPRFSVMRGRKQDPKAAAELLDVVLRRAPVKRSQYYDLVQIEEPGPEDEVIEPMADMGLGLPGMGAGARGADADPDAEGGDPSKRKQRIGAEGDLSENRDA